MRDNYRSWERKDAGVSLCPSVSMGLRVPSLFHITTRQWAGLAAVSAVLWACCQSKAVTRRRRSRPETSWARPCADGVVRVLAFGSLHDWSHVYRMWRPSNSLRLLALSCYFLAGGELVVGLFTFCEWRPGRMLLCFKLVQEVERKQNSNSVLYFCFFWSIYCFST